MEKSIFLKTEEKPFFFTKLDGKSYFISKWWRIINFTKLWRNKFCHPKYGINKKVQNGEWRKQIY